MAGRLDLLTPWRVEEFLLYAGFVILILALLPIPILTRMLTRILSYRFGPFWVSLFPTLFATFCTISQMIESHQRGMLLANLDPASYGDKMATKEKLFKAQRNMYLSILTLTFWLFIDRVVRIVAVWRLWSVSTSVNSGATAACASKGPARCS